MDASAQIRRVTYGAAACALLATLALIGFALWDARIAAALRDHGAITDGRRIGTSCSSSHDRHGFSSETCVGVWDYRVAGERFELNDRGGTTSELVETGPGWPPTRAGQIAYLPERPGTARLRGEIAPDLLPLLGGAGFFAVLAAVFGLAAYKLLGTGALRPPPVRSKAAIARIERRDLWISRAMLIGIPVAVIAGFFLI